MSKGIPIIINNFNRVTTLAKMVDDLRARGYHNIWVLDNTSTYPPLLEYYKYEESRLTIKHLGSNYIQNAIFDSGILQEFTGKYEWIVYTDSDLEFNPKMPRDFIERLIELADKYSYQKVGLALKIEDLPLTPWGQTNREWEEKFWLNEVEKDVYKSQIDTTFAIIKPTNGLMFEALRVAGDYTCKHMPWYLDLYNLNPEEQYYIDQSHSYSTYKRWYDTHVKR